MDNPMFNISYGLYIVSTKADDKDNGCICDTLMQVTSEPNQICVCLNKEDYTCHLLLKSGVFTASIISEKADMSLFKRFGFQSGRSVEKFQDFKAIRRMANGTLAITEGTNAFISAKVSNTMDLGSHILFIASVTDTGIISNEPSATYAYYQKYIKTKGQKAAENSGKTIWECKICGYEYDGEEIPNDFICPICLAPASEFEKVTK